MGAGSKPASPAKHVANSTAGIAMSRVAMVSAISRARCMVVLPFERLELHLMARIVNAGSCP